MKTDISKLSIIARDLRPQPGTPSKPSSSISVALWLGCSELYTWPISSSRDSLTQPLRHKTGKPSVTGSWSGCLHERPLSWLHSAQWDGTASPILSIIPIEMGTFGKPWHTCLHGLGSGYLILDVTAQEIRLPWVQHGCSTCCGC